MAPTTTPALQGLPPDFRSFYRLFRRACSAAVLHHGPEAVALRNLYRPTFRRAGLVYMRFESESPRDSEMNLKRKAWLDSWNMRMDNTLSLLYNSSHTRGLPHQITKFLGHFIYAQHFQHYKNKDQGLAWNPQLPRDSPEYKPKPKKPGALAKQIKQQQTKTFAENALGPLREVVRMAEARDGIVFGGLKNYTRVKSRKTPPRLDRLGR